MTGRLLSFGPEIVLALMLYAEMTGVADAYGTFAVLLTGVAWIVYGFYCGALLLVFATGVGFAEMCRLTADGRVQAANVAVNAVIIGALGLWAAVIDVLVIGLMLLLTAGVLLYRLPALWRIAVRRVDAGAAGRW